MTNLRLIIVGVLVIILGMVLFSSLYTVNEKQQALILEFGQPRDEERNPGLHYNSHGGRQPTMKSVYLVSILRSRKLYFLTRNGLSSMLTSGIGLFPRSGLSCALTPKSILLIFLVES